MKKLLVPYDFSDIAEHGLQLAAHLSNHLQAEIIILHIVNPPADTGFSAIGDISSRTDLVENNVYFRSLISRHKKDMEELINQFAAVSKANFTPELRIGQFEDQLNDYINHKKIDLVVMGTSGESTFSEIFLGNHTEQVIRESKCPILSVRHTTDQFQVKNLLLASDLHTGNDVEMRYLKEFASWFGCKIHLLHITAENKASDAEISKKMQEYVHHHQLTEAETYLVGHSDKEKAIKDFIAKHKIDMAAVTTRARSGLKNLFFGSFSEDMVKDLEVPVLVLTVNMES